MNVRFCGTAWDETVCSIDNHCPTGTECRNGNICHTMYKCNIQDMTAPPTSGPSSPPVVTAPPTPRPTTAPTARPTGPSRSPTPAPSAPPTTRRPTVRDDPRNIRFCADSWDTVRCSIENHCPTGKECTDGQMCFTDQRCNAHDLTRTPTAEPTTPTPTAVPSSSPILPPLHPSRFKFCGTDFIDAVERCSLGTHCASDASCAAGARCFENLPGYCNAFYLEFPGLGSTKRPTPPPTPPLRTFRPTRPPSARPVGTLRPTDEPSEKMPERMLGPTDEPSAVVVQAERPDGSEPSVIAVGQPSLWCGKTQSEANGNCGHSFFGCVDGQCPRSFRCFVVEGRLCEIATAEEATVLRTRRPTPSPVETTKRPTLAPITEKPTSRPVANGPNLQPTPPPTLPPTPQPVMNSPAKQTTSKHVTKRPLKQPTSNPVTNSPSNRPAQKPKNDAPANFSVVPEPLLLTNKKPSGGKPAKEPSNFQSTAKDVDATGKEEPKEKPGLQPIAATDTNSKEEAEEKLTMVEGLDTTSTTPNRPRFYCLSQSGNFDEECIHGMECSPGIPCPSGRFCLQFDCKNRPPSNGSLDLCPFRFVGMHIKDCKSYYECDSHGYVGPAHTCDEGLKFDKLSGGCISEFLVNSQCYQPESYTQTYPPDESFTEIESSDESSIQTDSSDESHDESPAPKIPFTTITSSPSPPPSTTSSSSSIPASATHSNTDSPSSRAFLWWETPPNIPISPGEDHHLSQWYKTTRNGSRGRERSRSLNVNFWCRILVPIQLIIFYWWALW